jgi:hypothetical protein
MAKVADDWFAGTVTVAGTVATDVLLLDRLITFPEGPANPSSPTVPVTTVADPPTTVEGDSWSVETVAGVTIRFCDAGARR